MDISVVVPVHDCAHCLDAALTSILGQQGCDLEVLAVDDGSADGSGKILDRRAAADARVRVFHQSNAGVAAARNFALGQARGEWLAFCDGDDTVPAGAYAALLRKTRGADVVAGAHRNRRDDGFAEVCRFPRAHRRAGFAALMDVPCVWTKLIRTAFLRERGLSFPELPLGEDVVFLGALAAARPRVAATGRIVYEHWRHESADQPSLIHTYDLPHFAAHLACRQRLAALCREAGIAGGEDYAFVTMSRFLAEFWPCIPGEGERAKAFERLRDFLAGYDWDQRGAFFEGCFGVPWAEFRGLPAERYWERLCLRPPRERVLRQFETGQLGLRYVLKYAEAWGAAYTGKSCLVS